MKTSKLFSRALAVILCVVMLLQTMPLAVFADETTPETPSEGINELPPEDSGVNPAAEGEEPDAGSEDEPVEASYMVEHYLQTADGYAIDEAATETKTGEVGAQTAATAKTYDGYTVKEFAQGIIAADGTTVVKIYYDVVVPAGPATAEYKVEHYLQTADGYAIDEAATETKTGEVGAQTAAEAKTYEGYTAKQFAQGTIAADGSTVVKIYYDITAPATAEYKVEHYLQNQDGKYVVDETATETKTGEVGADTAAVAKEFEGYTADDFEQAVIAEDGGTVVKIYYNKDSWATANGFPGNMTLVSVDESELAPGITEQQCIVYDKNGDRVLVYIATADVDVETVKIYANYKDNQNEVWGMQKTTDQAAAFEANHEGEKVIVAINGSYFNTSNGKPTGTFVMEGRDVTNEAEGNNYPFFALLKDGTYMIGAKNEYSSYKGQIQEAIGGYIHLVKDGTICSGLNAVEKYPRQTIGMTADGQVIIMTADCLSAVGSAGLTIYEQAEVMLALGCVEALHLDGGGSGTYCSKPVGSDTLQVTSNPSNGTERTVSNSLILVSTAKPDGEFDNAKLTAEHSYVTPGSTVNVTAFGLDQSGGAAEIPAEASWQLKDSALGTVENGVFTSNGTIGTATIQMVYNNAVVGSVSIEVVNPDKLDFGGMETVIVPYGQTADLPLKAYSGIYEVFYNVGDFTFTLAEDVAVIEGLKVTAPAADAGTVGTKLTVTLKADESVTVTVPLSFGKGSEVVFDFEDGTASADTDNWILRTHESDINNNEQGEIYIVNRENGLVHDGEQALAFHTDFSQSAGSGSDTSGYQALSLSWNGDPVNVKGAQSIGFWLYIPEDAVTTEISVNTVYTNSQGIQRRTTDAFDDNGELIYTPYWSTQMEESGWHYVKADFSKYTDDLFIHDEPGMVDKPYKRNFFIKIYCVVGGPEAEPFADHMGDFTYYIDNVTVDYSSAVEDRELPVFGDAYAYGSGTEKTMAYGKTVSMGESNLNFAARVSDNTTKNNYTGIDASSAKVYVDGNSVGASYAGGMISSGNVTLAEGYHRVRFEIADNNGNVKSIVREINITAASGKPTVELVPQDASLDRLLSGSVYWVDLVSEDIADIKSISTVLNLNSIHSWELDHMIVADGFDAEYYYASANQKEENNVSITFSRNGQAVDESSNVIASIPIRVWDSRIHTYSGHGGKTPAYMWTKGLIDHRQLRVRVDKGFVAFTDNTNSYFSDKIVVDHEAYTEFYQMDKTYHAAKGSYHTHTTAELADKTATCTEAGYTDRTYCEVCDSVVAWGTTQKATGHTYAITDGVLQCACGEKFTGIWKEDGREYVDGLVAADGWSGDSYYKDGVKLTGVQLIDGYYYDFGEDGICEGKMKFTGLFYDEAASAYRYAKLGEPQGGWVMIEGKWHYFDSTTKKAVTGDYYYESRGVTYHFDETGMTEGAWQKTSKGTRYWYGQWYYEATGSRVCFAEIDGKTYNFDSEGYMTTGIHALYWDWTANQRGEMRVWEFDQNGVFVGEITTKGLIDNKRGGMYLIEEDGYVHGGKANGRLVSYNGDLYFVVHSGKLKMNGFQSITAENSNGLLPDGTYYFGDDCKLFTGMMADADGVLYYYKDGKLGTGLYNSELMEFNGAIYLVKWSGKVAVNEIREVTAAKSNGLGAGTYEFDAEGKGKSISTFTGIKEGADGVLYYYQNGKLATQIYNSELVEIDGSIYLVKWSGKVAANETREITAEKANGLAAAGTYHFDENGKMLTTGVWKGTDGILYYYKDGKLGNQIYTSELVEINGSIYLVKWSGKVAANESRNITILNSNGLLKSGTYYFGEDGKLFTGLKREEDGILYYYKDGKSGSIYNSELAVINGEIYLVKWSGKVAENETRDIPADKTNGLLKAGTYYFGEDGKLFTGLKRGADGILYYYKDGKLGSVYNSELVEINGSIYLVKWSGKVAENETRVIPADKTNGLLKAGTYFFGEDGKLVTQ